MFGLHNHTSYSNALLGFSDSTNKVEDLIQEGKNLGLTGIAITEHEGLSSAYKALQYGKKNNIKVILGNEIYLQSDEQYAQTKDNYISGQSYYPHFILQAKDKIGFQQLCELSSIAWRDNSYWSHRLLRRPTKMSDIENVLDKNKGHIIAQTACLGSYFAHEIVTLIQSEKENNEENIYNHKLNIDNFIQWNVNIFGQNDFYIEIQPPRNNECDQFYYNQLAVKIAKAYNLKFIITTDSHYLGKKYQTIHKAFLNSKEAEREVDDFYATAYLMGEQEIRNYLDSNLSSEDIDTAIKNTDILGNSISEYSLDETQIIPVVQPPKFQLQHFLKKYYNQYEYIKKYAYSNNEQDRFLLWNIEQGICSKWFEDDLGIAADRINKELKELWLISESLSQPLGAYYNTMKKIIEITWTEGDSLVGVGRGSAGGFYIAYLLGIIQINPIKENLPYWRHISAERGHDLPD